MVREEQEVVTAPHVQFVDGMESSEPQLNADDVRLYCRAHQRLWTRHPGTCTAKKVGGATVLQAEA